MTRGKGDREIREGGYHGRLTSGIKTRRMVGEVLGFELKKNWMVRIN